MSDLMSEELRRLRLTMRDMVALSTLPAVWGGLPVDKIARSLADILIKTLAIDLVYVQLTQPSEGHVFEIGKARSANNTPSRECTVEARAALEPVLSGALTVELQNPFFEGALRATSARFGLLDDHGLVIAASSRADFPTEQDRLLLGFAANQVAQLVQQRRAEQELRLSEQRFLEYANAAPAILWATEANGVHSFFSAGWSEFTGQALSPEVHLLWLDAIHPEDREYVAEKFLVAHQEKRGCSVEYRVRRANGEYTCVLDTSKSRLSLSGVFLGLVGNIVDISERKRNEAKQVHLLKAVEAERQLLADVFHQSPSFMCILAGPDHVFERINEQYSLLIDRRDVIGRPLRVALPEVAEQDFIELLDNVYRTGETYIGKSHPVRLWSSNMNAVEERYLDFVYQARRSVDGTVIGVFVQGIDLTDRIQAEAVSKNEAARRTLLLATAKCILEAPVVDAGLCQQVFEIIGGTLESDIFYLYEAHPESLEMVASAGLPEHSIADFRRLPYTGTLCGVVCSTKRALAGNASQMRIEESGLFEKAIGVHAYCCHPLLRRDGHVLGTFAVASSRKDAFSSAEVEFLQTVSHFLALAWDRYQAEDALRRQERRKDEFLATLAHELRNPLAPIRTGLALFSRATSIEATQRPREIMERQVGHMVRLIDDLLEVSRITTGKVELKRETVDVRTIIHAGVELSRPLIDEGQHQLFLSLPGGPIYIHADPTRIAQVIGNLLNNSAKYTAPGGRIELVAEVVQNMAVIQVRDNGAGLTQEDLAEVFELFSQIRNTLDRSQAGLGIGLALVKRLVEMHGGSVLGSSPGPGQGSTFKITLPLAVPEVNTGSRLHSGGHHCGPMAAQKILVVDDNEDAAETLSLLLRSMGHIVQTVHTGSQALELATSFSPDIVFLDIGLPVMNGYEVACRLRSSARMQQAALIALTGWGTAEDQKRARDAGFDHHITKPFETETLERLIREIDRTATTRGRTGNVACFAGSPSV